MSKPSIIAQLGIVNILNQMKNPLTNIRLSIEMLENGEELNKAKYMDIIKTSAINLEDSIRDLCQSFDDAGVVIHLEANHTQFEVLHEKAL